MPSSRQSPQVLAIDLGTSGMKVALIAYDGTLTGWADEPVDLLLLPDGGAEQNPEDWWQALGKVVGELGRKHPEALKAVTTICASTQGEGTIAINKDGTPLTNCITWLDMRGADNLMSQFGGKPAIRGFSARRLARWLRLTGGVPSPTGKDPAAHMLYIRDEMPQIYAHTHMFLNVLDYMNMRLTGNAVATVDSILTSWVTDNRDPNNISYHPALVADSGIDGSKLPPIVSCTDVVGRLSREAATFLGLPETVEVVAGAIDTTAAAIGAGTTEDYQTHLYLGTSSWMAAHVPYKKTDPLSGLASVPCALPNKYLLIGLQATAGANLTFLRDNILHADDGLPHDAVDDMWAALDELVPSVPAGSNGVMYTPWLYGERAPVDDLNLRAGLFNISLDTTRGDMARAIYEGVALNTRWMFEPVQKFLRRPATSISIVGGGAQSAHWCQIFADVLGVGVRQLADPITVNARGAAWIGAVGTGEMSFSDLPGLVRTAARFEPDPANRLLYDEAFDIYTSIHKRMAPVYARLAKNR